MDLAQTRAEASACRVAGDFGKEAEDFCQVGRSDRPGSENDGGIGGKVEDGGLDDPTLEGKIISTKATDDQIDDAAVSLSEAADLAANPPVIAVGPLFGVGATVRVQREHPANVPWLQLKTGRGVFPAPAAPTGPLGLGLDGGAPADSHQVEGDGAQVTLHAGDDPPAPGTAHVYRVTGTQGGATFGGYTVVVLG